MLNAIHPQSALCHHLDFVILSLKLIRGSIDQVDETAQITWVQPRVLSRQQIGVLADRLTAWCDRLKKVEQQIAPEIPAVS
jgi:26S proteasome regulatory subunit N9